VAIGQQSEMFREQFEGWEFLGQLHLTDSIGVVWPSPGAVFFTTTSKPSRRATWSGVHSDSGFTDNRLSKSPSDP
jgi:hypothetical protein